MVSETAPAVFGELHPLPIVVARLVLAAELHAERLGGRALGRCDVRLELHGVRAGVGDGVHERVREAEAAVVRERNLADDQASSRAERTDCRMRHDLTWTGTPRGSRARRSSAAKRPAPDR